MKLNLERLKSRLAEVVLDEIKEAVRPVVQAARRPGGSDIFSQIDSAIRGFVEVDEPPDEAGIIDAEAEVIPNP